MNNIEIVWNRQTTQYSNGYNGYLGKYIVFTCNWDSANNKGNALKHKLNCTLPGIKTYLGNFTTGQEAFNYADKTLKTWIKGAGLSVEAIQK